MKNTRTALLTLATALFLTASATPQTPDSTSMFWTTGIRINQGQPFGLLGITKRLNSRLYQYTGADLGGIERSITTQTALRITKPATWTLFALIGPQVETIETDPTREQTTDYLTASTGAIITYHRNQTLSIFAGFQYLWTEADIKRWKLGLGILVPLDLS